MQNSQPKLFSNRREFLRAITAAATAGGFSSAITSVAVEIQFRVPIGFSLYGMKTLPVAEALKVCSEIGYDCVELAVMADWPCAPEKLTAAARRDIRQQLNDRHLKLAALMENLPLAVDGDKHRDNLDRFKRAFELSRDLSPDQTPLIETILGGSPDKWPLLKDKFVERLRDWAAVAAEHKAILTIKAHVAGALHLPQDAAELKKARSTRRCNWHLIRATFSFATYQWPTLGRRWQSERDSCMSKMVEASRERFSFYFPAMVRSTTSSCSAC